MILELKPSELTNMIQSSYMTYQLSAKCSDPRLQLIEYRTGVHGSLVHGSLVLGSSATDYICLGSSATDYICQPRSEGYPPRKEIVVV